MPPKRAGRIYTRTRGKNTRYYADFRDFSDVGGKREALIAPGEHYATTDPDVAAALMTARLEELEAARRGRVLGGGSGAPTLKEYARRHLILLAEAGEVSETWLTATQRHLTAALEYFGSDRPLDTITARDVTEWTRALRRRRSNRLDPTDPTGERRLPLAPGTVRHFLNALSGLYSRAISEAEVPLGSNPVAAMKDKPTHTEAEAAFLSVPDAALLLEAARTYRPERPDRIAVPFMYELLATFLLTGGRRREVFGLAPEDVSLERGVVMFRPHPWRDLKTRGSRRNVPLWPQLAEILRPYLNRTDRAPGRLLFPSRRTGRMITDIRRPLRAIARRAGLDPAALHLHAFRHTYTAARLQTLDHGAPVSVFTVSRELGHTSTALVERIYGHVSGTRHRSEVVEYRVDQHRELEARVRELRALEAAGG